VSRAGGVPLVGPVPLGVAPPAFRGRVDRVPQQSRQPHRYQCIHGPRGRRLVGIACNTARLACVVPRPWCCVTPFSFPRFSPIQCSGKARTWKVLDLMDDRCAVWLSGAWWEGSRAGGPGVQGRQAEIKGEAGVQINIETRDPRRAMAQKRQVWVSRRRSCSRRRDAKQRHPGGTKLGPSVKTASRQSREKRRPGSKGPGTEERGVRRRAAEPRGLTPARVANAARVAGAGGGLNGPLSPRQRSSHSRRHHAGFF
jgi:hypothetical protein